MQRVAIVHGDITELAVDAVVNAANQRMLGGGGVDGAIHRAAGPELREACQRVPEVKPDVRCPTGESRITPGFRLPARYVIHTVGPRYRDGRSGERALLRSSYLSALELARSHQLRSIAFPAISCGAYGYPVAEAAAVAREAISEFLASDSGIEQVILVAFEPEVHAAFRTAFG